MLVFLRTGRGSCAVMGELPTDNITRKRVFPFLSLSPEVTRLKKRYNTLWMYLTTKHEFTGDGTMNLTINQPVRVMQRDHREFLYRNLHLLASQSFTPSPICFYYYDLNLQRHWTRLFFPIKLPRLLCFGTINIRSRSSFSRSSYAVNVFIDTNDKASASFCIHLTTWNW